MVAPVPYLLFLGALSMERLFELWLSGRNARRALAAGAVEVAPGQHRLICAFHALFLLACAAEAVILQRPFPGTLGWLALGGAIAAQGLRYWAIATLGPRWSTRVIVRPGEPPVTWGPYRWLRHPNYLAVVAEILLIPLIQGCWTTALVFSAAHIPLITWRIATEERALGEAWRRAFV
jgi:methyltransferase